MKRLSGTDALFLSMETPSWHQHVGGLTILEPGDRPVVFEDLVRTIEERLPAAPKFMWKIKEMPFGLDRPAWIDDPDFDVRNHIRRIAVPTPGGPKETAEVAGMILSTQLDRNRPLWEMWFVEGVIGGRVALIMKYHHCLMDGMAGASLATLLMDLEPNPTETLVTIPPPEEQSAGHDPSNLEVLARAALEAARRPARVAQYLVGGVQKIAGGAVEALRNDESRAILRAPETPFNAPIGPRRSLAFTSVSMEDLRKLKTHHDVKINDLVLTLVSGALRKYLDDQGILPEASLSTGVPVSMRAEGDTTHDNKISTMFLSLNTDVEDPIERLKAIATSAQSAKAMQKALSARQIQSLGEVASPLILSTAVRAVFRLQLMSRLPARVNTLVSNVPGPPIPLYSCGAQISGIFPSSVIVDGMGVNCTVISYMDRLDFGFHVDPDLVPDPWAISEAVPAALAELMEASGLGAPTPVKDPFGTEVGGPAPAETNGKGNGAVKETAKA